MKYRIFHLLLFTALVSVLSACVRNNLTGPLSASVQADNYRLIRMEFSTGGYVEFSYDSNNRVSGCLMWGVPDFPDGKAIFEYDMFGRIIKRENYDISSVYKGYNTYEYDYLGRFSKSAVYIVSSLLYSYEYLFDTAGETEYMLFRYYTGDIAGYIEYEYNTNGSVLRKTVRNYEATFNARQEYEYDNEGKLIRMDVIELYYAPDGYHDLQYDSQGRLARAYRYDSSGAEEFNITYIYENSPSNTRFPYLYDYDCLPYMWVDSGA